jgi:ABC-type uncharacterized transport system YnjBCD permease subunit
MTAGLVAKEMPFLLLMALAALPALDGSRRRMVMASLGYGRGTGFFIAIAPQLYRLIRLPVFAVIAYASSVADVAIVLGPTTPAPLPVRILEWASDPELATRFTAAAAALIQVVLTLSCSAFGCSASGSSGTLVAVGGQHRASALAAARPVRIAGLTVSLLPMLAIALGLALLILWSFAGRWRFPDASARKAGACAPGSSWAARRWIWPPPPSLVGRGANAHCGGADHLLPGGGARHRAQRRQPLASHPLCAAARAAGDVSVRLAVSGRRAACSTG